MSSDLAVERLDLLASCPVCHARLSLLQVGNVSVRELSVENPSDQPLAVHLTLLSDYPATQATMDIIRQL